MCEYTQKKLIYSVINLSESYDKLTKRFCSEMKPSTVAGTTKWHGSITFILKFKLADYYGFMRILSHSHYSGNNFLI